MNLIIVESPAKGKTIEKFLGKDFKVVASFGHVRDLPKKELGVDIEKDFTPKYIILPRSRKVVSFLKKMAQSAKNLYLATDFDREGEAIAFHIRETLKAKGKSLPAGKAGQKAKLWQRITFHEITKDALQDALKNPRDIDLNLVNAQQARRILDRLVGYKLSPFLWDKIASGLSAGRVQSVALRLIVEREKEIEKFVPQEYWSVEADLSKKRREKDKKFRAVLSACEGKAIDKLEIKSKKEAQKILAKLKSAKYQVEKIQQQKTFQYPFPPFTTSTLQQDSFHRLGFSVKKTMRLAQDLYEAGYITYMRTDSTNLSWLAINSIRKYILEEIGKKYLSAKPRVYAGKQVFAQEAHEAIRPTYVKNILLKENKKITSDHQKLYNLIWRRAVACQMSQIIFDQIKVEILASKYTFTAHGKTIDFEGFMKVYPLRIEQVTLPVLKVGEILDLIKLYSLQHFTKPPFRYTQATLIKALEENGIGRPSTYAPIISIILFRGYVILKRGYFYPTEVGTMVCELLVSHFPEIVDIDFTAQMEEDLDEVAAGKKDYLEILRAFYFPFQKKLDLKMRQVAKNEILNQDIKEKCPKCKGKLVWRISKFGRFIGCSNFPKCKYTKSVNNK